MLLSFWIFLQLDPFFWRIEYLWPDERESGQCSFQDDCSPEMMLLLLRDDVQSNGNETWNTVCSRRRGKILDFVSTCTCFPVFPERYSGQFAQIFNIKVSSFISNVLLPPLSVVNSLASDFVAPTFRYLDIYRKDESNIYINIFFIHHPLRDKTRLK